MFLPNNELLIRVFAQTQKNVSPAVSHQKLKTVSICCIMLIVARLIVLRLAKNRDASHEKNRDAIFAY
jgi:hypothetical protein